MLSIVQRIILQWVKPIKLVYAWKSIVGLRDDRDQIAIKLNVVDLQYVVCNWNTLWIDDHYFWKYLKLSRSIRYEHYLFDNKLNCERVDEI